MRSSLERMRICTYLWILLVLPKVVDGALPSNLALSTRGATCTSSSGDCYLTIDGGLTALSSEWFPGGGALGSWIQVVFAQPGMYTLKYTRIMQRFNKIEQFKDVNLTYADGSYKTVTLSQRQGTMYHDLSGQSWDTFNLDGAVTDSVRITPISAYTQHNNGFVELEFYGYRCGVMPGIDKEHCTINWDVKDGNRLTPNDGDLLGCYHVSYEMRCVALCTKTTCCYSASYRFADRQCCLYMQRINHQLVDDNEYVSFLKY